MSFATDHLGQLARFAQHRPLPRVLALHLQPEPAPGGPRGEFSAIEPDDGSLGLSCVLLDDTLQRLREPGPALGLRNADALQVARRYVDGPGAQRTIGFAAANALTHCLYERAGWRPEARLDPNSRCSCVAFRRSTRGLSPTLEARAPVARCG